MCECGRLSTCSFVAVGIVYLVALVALNTAFGVCYTLDRSSHATVWTGIFTFLVDAVCVVSTLAAFVCHG
jgi:hypothetical protein